jgi:hypothetical protein
VSGKRPRYVSTFTITRTASSATVLPSISTVNEASRVRNSNRTATPWYQR